MRFIGNCIALFVAGVALGMYVYEWGALSELRRFANAFFVLALAAMAVWNLRQLQKEGRVDTSLSS